MTGTTESWSEILDHRARRIGQSPPLTPIRRAAWASADTRMLARMHRDPAVTRDQVTDLYRSYRAELTRTGISLAEPPPAAGTSHSAQWGPGNNAQRPRNSARLTTIAGWAWSVIAARVYSWRADCT